MSPPDAVRAMQLIEGNLEIIDNSLRHLNGNINDRMGNEIMLDAKDLGVA